MPFPLFPFAHNPQLFDVGPEAPEGDEHSEDADDYDRVEHGVSPNLSDEVPPDVDQPDDESYAEQEPHYDAKGNQQFHQRKASLFALHLLRSCVVYLYYA